MLSRLLPRRPRLLSLTAKEKFLSLQTQRKASVIERKREMLYGISASLIVLIGLIQLMSHRPVQGEASERMSC